MALVRTKATRFEAGLEAVARAGAPLTAFTDFGGRVDRGAFLGAGALALVALAAARAMDMFVFGTGPGRSPTFFAAIAGAGLLIVLPALVVRRLRDAGSGCWAILLALVPIVGWLALCHRLLSPTAALDVRSTDP